MNSADHHREVKEQYLAKQNAKALSSSSSSDLRAMGPTTVSRPKYTRPTKKGKK